MRILSPAKINLHLRVAPLAADGFHPLLSWMCTVGLHDTMEMELATEPGVRLKCDRADVPVDGTNLIVRAGRALGNGLGAEVTLQKKIPMGGGLGGGSSNAAFALIGFNEIWNLNYPIERLAKIGATLGSDVPFFFTRPEQHLRRPWGTGNADRQTRREIRDSDFSAAFDVHAGGLSAVR